MNIDVIMYVTGQWCTASIFLYKLVMHQKTWRPKVCNGYLILKLVVTTGDLAFILNFTHCVCVCMYVHT